MKSILVIIIRRREIYLVFGLVGILALGLQLCILPYLNDVSKWTPDGNAYDHVQIPDESSLVQVSSSGDLNKAGNSINAAGLLESRATLFGASRENSEISSVKRDAQMLETALQKNVKTKTFLFPYVNLTMVEKINENPLMVSMNKPASITEASDIGSDPISSYASQSQLLDLRNSSTGLGRLLIGKAQRLRNGHRRRHNYPPIDKKKMKLSSLDKELLSARKEISHAPFVENVYELYTPLFHNLPVFKRSYELMEKVFKVYVYKEGAEPIFHKPYLRGIYASEGWFMKLMETNRHFVVKQPNKAHMFYLPYSALRLRVTLNVTGPTRQNALAIFLKNYVDMLARKYPFWNRTQGADHFLVACHDWGPQETRLHDELRHNSVKALCNANPTRGFFKQNRDVSLPTTYIRSGNDPLKDVGGKPLSQRPILAFFAGQMHGRVRPVLVQHWENDTDMKIQGPMPDRIQTKASYRDNMKSSKFCICPRGHGVNSPRVVEAIYYECVPVIISDDYILPFTEVLNWNAFSVIVREKDIPRLKNILLLIPETKYHMLQLGVRRVQKHFLWHAKPVKYDLFHMILHSIWFNRLNHVGL